MPILTDHRPPRAAVHSIREVRVGIPHERRAEIMAFYAEVFGLCAWPAKCQIPGGWGAGDPRRGVYFQFRHDPGIEPMRRRFVLLVNSLAALEKRLRQRAWPFWRRRGLSPCDHCLFLHDPAGHQLEIREVRPL